jgi:Ca2+:H+ antiporter
MAGEKKAMNQHEIVERPKPKQQSLKQRLGAESPTLVGLIATVVVVIFQEPLFGNLGNDPVTLVKFIALFGVMLWCAFGVVRHADAIASRLGEPYGTLVLTLSVIVIEVSLMAAIILHGENNPTLARDVMFSTLMIVLNGMVGTALLMGALRYWEQEYNLEGARAFLVVIASLAVFGLIIPNYTKSTPDPSLFPYQAGLFATITILFYVVFVIIQTARHRAFFAEPVNGENGGHAALMRQEMPQHRPATGSLGYHVILLLLTLLPVVLLSEFLAVLVDFGIEQLKLPAALGGILIAILVLSPEGLTAFHAALANQLQRAVNVCLGSALATIGLTIPAVLLIGMITGREVHLGLDQLQEVLLILTLFVSALTFGGARTNVLQGIVHLLLFFVYLALIVSP